MGHFRPEALPPTPAEYRTRFKRELPEPGAEESTVESRRPHVEVLRQFWEDAFVEPWSARSAVGLRISMPLWVVVVDTIVRDRGGAMAAAIVLEALPRAAGNVQVGWEVFRSRAAQALPPLTGQQCPGWLRLRHDGEFEWVEGEPGYGR